MLRARKLSEDMGRQAVENAVSQCKGIREVTAEDVERFRNGIANGIIISMVFWELVVLGIVLF